MRHLDLFTGIMGFAYAAKQVWGDDYQLVACCEREPYCQDLIRLRAPGVPIHDDKTTMDGTQYAGTVDLITGGDPCQPHSQAGKRLGEEDHRYLWPSMFDRIQEVRPRWVINENVVGSVSNGVLDQKIDDMEGAGYTCQSYDIPAVAVGAWHRRHRIWLVANTNRSKPELCWQNGRVGRKELDKGLRYWQSPPVPFVRRMDARVSRRVDRLRGLGNAIVPQVAMVIMQAIKEIDDATHMEN